MGEIYKVINNITKKIYIGKTKRKTEYRWKEHIQDSKRQRSENIPLHQAIIKYGEDNFSVEILESGIDEKNLNDREKYYIKKYNSTNSNVGYNATIGGDGGVVHTKLSSDEVKQIKELLSDTSSDISINQIAKLFKVTGPTIKAINEGNAWIDNSISYPIRKYSARALGIDKLSYEKIVNELKNPQLKMEEIAIKYNISISCIWAINQGKYCYNGKNDYYKDIYSEEFPIRKTNQKIDCDFNKVFYEVLFTNKSISQIEREFNINFSGLRYIILGKRRRNITKDYIVPMREHVDENRIIWNKINEV